MADSVAIDQGAGESLAPLADVIRRGLAELMVPGAVVGVLHGDREFAAGFGVTNVNHPLAVDADTLFQIGSISKTFAGTAAMRLVERGALDLDAPIRTYLPDFRLSAEDVVEIRIVSAGPAGTDPYLWANSLMGKPASHCAASLLAENRHGLSIVPGRRSNSESC